MEKQIWCSTISDVSLCLKAGKDVCLLYLCQYCSVRCIEMTMISPDLPQGGAPNTIPLLFGHPDPATLLTPELRQAMERVISSPYSYAALQYGAEQGTQNLVEVLVEKINREQELSLQPGNLMVVAGSTHAVDMLARLYGRPGGVVLVEAP